MFGPGHAFGFGASASRSAADTATPPVTAVSSDGWQATMATPSDLSFAAIPLTRQGFDSSGAAISATEMLATTRRVRQPYPNHASLTASAVALSDYVYSTDAIAGATNNSLEVSPRPIAAWVTPDRAIVGNSLTIDLVAFHRNARNGKPVAAVTGTASDGTTTVTAATSTPILLAHAGDQNPVIGYRLTFDISTLADQSAITVNGKVYPHVGGAASVLDSASGTAGDRGFVPMIFFKHLSKFASPPFAYVDAATGVDATVDASGMAGGNIKVSTSAASAAANPFATIQSAVNALRLATAVTGGFSTGCVLRVQGAVIFDAASYITATYQNGAELVIEGVAGSSPAITFGASNRTTGQTYLRFRNLAFNRTGTAAIGNNTTRLVLENVTMDGGGAATPFSGTGTHVWLLGLTLTNPGTNLNFGTSQQLRLARGIACASGFQIENWLTIGCHVQGPLLFISQAGRPPHGGICAFNRMMKATGATILFPLSGMDVNGFAFVQNVIEKIDTINAAAFRPSGDSDTGNITHLICWNNSFAGFGLYGRGNILYDEHASIARTHRLQSFRGNIHVQLNHKSDIFLQNGSRTGAWGYGFGVGCLGEFSQFVDAGPNLASFRQDYPGMKAHLGTSQTVRNDPLFVSYQATTNSGASPVAGAGNGNYALQSGSPAIGLLSAAEEALPFDLAGAARDRGSVGAHR